MEWTFVLLLIAAFFVFNFATYNIYPAVWCDEITFSEPAVNFAHDRSFTTSVFAWQPYNSFPAANCPLYAMVLGPWLSVAGTSLLAIRSFNYALMGLAAFLLWVVSWRYDLVKTSLSRVALVALVHLGYGLTFAYRCSRPDILGLNCLLLLVLAFGMRRKGAKEIAIAGFGALTIWIGLQVSLYAWIATATAWLILRRIGFRELLVLSTGMCAGMVLLLLFFQAQGVLVYFLPLVSGQLGTNYAHSPHLPFGAKLKRFVLPSLNGYVEDFSLLPLLLGLALVALTIRSKLPVQIRRLVLFSVALAFAVPPLFNLAGHYGFYYSYMIFVPVALAFFSVLSALQTIGAETRTQWLRIALAVAVTISMLVGLPMRLVLVLSCSKLSARNTIQKVVREHVEPSDVAFSDFGAFFEVKQRARVVFDAWSSVELRPLWMAGHDFTTEEKQAVSVLVVRPAEIDFFARFFGGRWQAISEAFGDEQDVHMLARFPIIGPKLAHYFSQPQSERYKLQIFRRERVTVQP